MPESKSGALPLGYAPKRMGCRHLGREPPAVKRADRARLVRAASRGIVRHALPLRTGSARSHADPVYRHDGRTGLCRGLDLAVEGGGVDDPTVAADRLRAQ